MRNFLKIFQKEEGQTLTEFVLIIVFVGLVLSIASSDLFSGVKVNYYQGMLPLSKGAEVPDSPSGTNLNGSKKKPQAIIKGPLNAHIGQEITFNDQSVDPDGRIVSTSWGKKTITKKFMEEGNYTVSLTVVDNDGFTNTAMITIAVGNDKPVAVITTDPEGSVPMGQDIKVSGSRSTDPEGDQLEAWEWYMSGPNMTRQKMDWPLNNTTIKGSTLTSGTYTFELKVMDTYQTWSTVATKTIEVVNRKPNAVITMTPNSNIDSETTITWNHTQSSDPDGDAIVDAEWQNKKDKYPAGSQTVQLRVKDAKGMWSDWASVTFTVSAFIPVTQTFNYTANVQTFTVPHTGKYKLELWGAQGGRIGTNSATGGRGAYATGIYTATQGTVLYIYVGGKGGDGGDYIDGYLGRNNNGGWNGGGSGTGSRGPGGGGATDIRTTNNTNYSNRIIVAGGGGGGFRSTADVDAGYTTNITSTALGQDGEVSWWGSNQNWESDNGGGGGGYNGGKTILGDDPSRGYGGTSYIGGVTSGSAITGDQVMPSPTGGTMTGREGNGTVIITRIP